MNSIDLIVAERCFEYGVIASALKANRASSYDTLSAARMQIAWDLRTKWAEYGLKFQPSFPDIARAVGYKSHTSVLAAIRNSNKRRRDRTYMQVERGVV